MNKHKFSNVFKNLEHFRSFSNRIDILYANGLTLSFMNLVSDITLTGIYQIF